MISASTLLFMKKSPESGILRIDYAVALLCTVLYVIDFFDLFLTTIIFSTSYRSKEEHEKMAKNFENKKKSSIKKIMGAYLSNFNQNIELSNSSAELNKTESPLRTIVNKVNSKIILAPKNPS